MTMDFKKFNEDTSKIRSFPGSYITDFDNLKRVEGWYFPNSKEILNTWKLASTQEVQKYMQEHDGRILYNKEDGLPSLFLSNLEGRINMKGLDLTRYLKDGKEKLEEALRKTGYEAPNMPNTISSDDLANAIGLMFERTGLLHNDIRIVALDYNEKATFIQDLMLIGSGYSGMLVDPSKSPTFKRKANSNEEYF
jgi:hypothetical protein